MPYSICVSPEGRGLPTQLSLFDKNEVPTDEYNKIIDKITSKYGNTSILRASSLLKSSTIKNRERYKNTI